MHQHTCINRIVAKRHHTRAILALQERANYLDYLIVSTPITLQSPKRVNQWPLVLFMFTTFLVTLSPIVLLSLVS